MKSKETVQIDGANIAFRNFKGEERQYNAEGDRNFCVILEPDLAEFMRRDGYNIKLLKSRDETEQPRPYIQVTVSFKGRIPPRLVMIGSRGRVNLDQDTCELLDQVEIENVDLIINPYDWGPIRGESGRAAYLKSFFLTIREDPLELRYAHVPEIGASQHLQLEAAPAYDLNGEVIEGEIVPAY